MSAKQFVFPNGLNSKQKRFSIDDAFEEETDEAIRVYGTSGICEKPSLIGEGDCSSMKMKLSGYGRF